MHVILCGYICPKEPLSNRHESDLFPLFSRFRLKSPLSLPRLADSPKEDPRYILFVLFCQFVYNSVTPFMLSASHDKLILNSNIMQQGIRNAWCFIFFSRASHT